MNAWSVFVTLLFSIFSILNSSGCTVFYVSGDGIVYAGNNEDWKDPYSRMFFYPAEENKHGWIKFGWAGGFPQGGMNDCGVFRDAEAGPYLVMPVSEATKSKDNSLQTPEAITIFSSY